MIVVVISIDRCIMIHWPLYHHSHCTLRYLIAGSLSGLLVFVAIFITPLFGVGKPYMYFAKNGFCAIDLSTAGSVRHKMLVATIGALLSTCVCIIIVCNVAMVLKLRRSTQKLEKLAGGSSNGNSTRQSTRAQHTQAFQRLTVAIAIINIVLNLPFAVSIHTHIHIYIYAWVWGDARW